MSVEDCADILRSQDPDRFLAAMAAPVANRGNLMAIYAFNIEVARAAWISAEPMICQMRLRWWSDQLQEIGQMGNPGGHAVLTPLASAIDGETADVLADVIAAKHWDLAGEPFTDGVAFDRHLGQIGGSLTWAAARSIGATSGEQAIRDMGYASALANWFLAIPELRARGRVGLVDDSDVAIRELAQNGLERMNRARKLVPPIARPATRAGWRTAKTLRLADANPAAVAGGRLHSSEFFRRASLVLKVLSNSA